MFVFMVALFFAFIFYFFILFYLFIYLFFDVRGGDLFINILFFW